MRYLSGKDLLARWSIEGFELFEFMAQGLQSYSKYGKKIVDLGTLELKRKWSEDEILKRLRIEQGAHNTQFVVGAPKIGEIKKKLTDDELKSAARREYFKQPTDTPVIPDGCIAMDLNLSLDEDEAVKQIKDAMDFRFKMKDMKEFETDHGLTLVSEMSFSSATNDSLSAFVDVASESVIEKNLKGKDLLKRWEPWGIVNGQMLKYISEGELLAYLYDGKKIADKKLRVLEKISQVIKNENPNLPENEIKKIAFKRGQEEYPNLPWNAEKYHFTNLTPPKNIKTCGHKELGKIDEMIKNMQHHFLFRESDIVEFERRHFTGQIKDSIVDNCESINASKNDGGQKKSGQKNEYSKKNKVDLVLLVKAWSKQGMENKDIAVKLFAEDLKKGVKIESLIRKVQRYKNNS